MSDVPLPLMRRRKAGFGRPILLWGTQIAGPESIGGSSALIQEVERRRPSESLGFLEAIEPRTVPRVTERRRPVERIGSTGGRTDRFGVDVSGELLDLFGEPDVGLQ
jgi:hypothetical protein